MANEALEAISVVGLDAGGGVEGEACLFAPELIGMGLQDVLFKMRLNFDSPEALELTARIQPTIFTT